MTDTDTLTQWRSNPICLAVIKTGACPTTPAEPFSIPRKNSRATQPSERHLSV
jgi:hypothetical protein